MSDLRTFRRQLCGTLPGAVLLLIFALLGLSGSVTSQTQGTNMRTAQKDTFVSKHATGPFDVKTTPQSAEDKSETPLGLDGTGVGEMLTAGSPVKGSGAYVAIERVSGTLQGRTGTFVLQHTGTMNHGVPQLSITIVPDSGTGELTGISGKLNITISEGKHTYDLEYSLPAAQ